MNSVIDSEQIKKNIFVFYRQPKKYQHILALCGAWREGGQNFALPGCVGTFTIQI